MLHLLILGAIFVFLVVRLVFKTADRRTCPKHGPFSLPAGCGGCQAYLYAEMAKGRDPWEVIFEDVKKND